MFNPMVPYASFTQFTPALPEFYWNVYSSEQRIKHICKEFCKIIAYCDELAEELNGLEPEIRAELQEFYNRTEKLNEVFREEVIHLIEQLEVGNLQWDVLIGEYADTVTAQRDMFNMVTAHSYTIAQLNEILGDNLTVQSLANSGLNARGFGVFNEYLISGGSLKPDFRY